MLAKALSALLIAAGLTATTLVVYNEFNRTEEPAAVTPAISPSETPSSGTCTSRCGTVTPPSCCGN
jgi:hypothetical protein